MRTALGAAAVLVYPVVLMLVLRWIQRRGWLGPELSRKLFHIGGGFLGLALPWLTPEPWVVVGLTTLSIGGLFILRRSQQLNERAGKVLTAVGRDSLGDICFPLSVCILFIVARHQPELYYIPVLILTFGDALAALIGVRYGLKRYVATEGYKSVEGSAAFFITTFFCVHVWLLLATKTGRLESLLIGVMMGLLVMMLEAVAWNGLDNLFVPLASFVLLRVFLRLEGWELGERLAETVALALVVLVIRKRTTLNPSGLIGAVFVGYVLWIGGDFRWILLAALVMAAYSRISPDTEWDRVAIHDIHVVLCVSSAALGYLFCREAFSTPDLLLPAAVGWAAHLALIAMVRCRLKSGEPPVITDVVMIMKAWLVIFVPYGLMTWLRLGTSSTLLLDGMFGLLGMALAVLVYQGISPPIRTNEVNVTRWRWQAVAAAAGSLVGLGPLVLRGVSW